MGECKGKCADLIAGFAMGRKRFAAGQRYCCQCEAYMELVCQLPFMPEWKGKILCPCCRTPTRANARRTQAKKPRLAIVVRY